MKKIFVSIAALLSLIVFNTSFTLNNKPAIEKDVEIVQKLYSDFAKGDVPALLQRFDPKIVWNEAENFPYADGNPYIGPQAVLEGVFAKIGAEWEYWNLTDQTYYEAKSGEIIVTGRYKAKNKLTGKEINVQFVHMWTLNDGLVTKFQQYADTYQTVEAMK
ncbi:MAG: nuclear transport factor 2 family protein [Ignavibacterium sp.]